jgi:tetratricopeptide (TPR) repeat protein
MAGSSFGNVVLDWNDEHDLQVLLSNLLVEARQAIQQDRPTDAFNLLFDAAIHLADHLRNYRVAAETTQLLRSIIPADVMDREMQAWLLNLEGLIRIGQGRVEEAAAAFRDMRALGQELSDRVIELTASQNLGIVAFESGDLNEASRHYTESLRGALDAGDHYTATQLLLNLSTVAQETGNFDRSEEILGTVHEIVAELPDAHLAASFHLNSGNLDAKQHQFLTAEEHFRQALRYARRTGEQSMQLFAIQNLGNVYLDQGKLGKALRRYRQAIRIAEKTDATPTLEALFRSLAMALYRAGRYQEAVNNLENARSIALILGEPGRWARATADLGAILLETSNAGSVEKTEQATELLLSALDVLRNIEDTEWQALALTNLAEVKRMSGDPAGAAILIEEALDVIPEQEHDWRAALLQRIAEAWAAKRDGGDLAVSYFERLFDAHGASDSGRLAWYTALSAATLSEYGHNRHATAYYTRALKLYEQTGDDQMAFHVRNDRGIALSKLGLLQEAREDFQECLALARRLNDRVMEQQVSLNLGEIERRAGVVDKAIPLLERAVELSKDLGDTEKEAEALGNLGIALREADKVDEAEVTLRNARDLARQLRSLAKEALAVGGLAGVAFVRGHFGRAERSYRRAEKLNRTVLDLHHALEDRAGVVESLSARGRSENLQDEIQRLIDLAQDLDDSEFGAEALARSARWWLRRDDLEEAASLYGIAIVLAGTRATGSDEELVEHISKPMSVMAIHVRLELNDDPDAFYEQVIANMNEQFDGIGDSLRDMLSQTREAVADLDMDQEE